MSFWWKGMLKIGDAEGEEKSQKQPWEVTRLDTRGSLLRGSFCVPIHCEPLRFSCNPPTAQLNAQHTAPWD